MTFAESYPRVGFRANSASPNTKPLKKNKRFTIRLKDVPRVKNYKPTPLALSGLGWAESYCAVCGNGFMRHRSAKTFKFCSRKCYGISRRKVRA